MINTHNNCDYDHLQHKMHDIGYYHDYHDSVVAIPNCVYGICEHFIVLLYILYSENIGGIK